MSLNTPFFSLNGSCPDFPFSCKSPQQACAFAPLFNKYYCCQSDVCFTGSTTCAKSGGTLPSSQQQCSGYCCLADSERCTQTVGQTNVCWGTQPNPLGNLTDKQVSNLFSSLSARHPAATTLQIDPTAVAKLLSSDSSSATSTSSSSSSSASSAPTSSVVSPSSQSSGLSGGAIAGIVVGAVVALAIFTLALVFLLRRRQKKSAWSSPPPSQTTENNPPANPGYKEYYAHYGSPALTAPQHEQREPFLQSQQDVRHELPAATPELQGDGTIAEAPSVK